MKDYLEVTEEMVEAAAEVFDEVEGGITISGEEWEAIIRKAICAAIAKVESPNNP